MTLILHRFKSLHETRGASERRILAAAHRWGLHTVEGYGRLSVLRQLALLQHYGTPTRLVDVSLNALIALWFAVEDGNGSDRDKADGRVFAIDTTDRVINETDEYRSYEDMLKRPWRPKEHKPEFDLWESKDVAGPEWSTSYWVWIPSGQEPRIRSQHGAFLFGGVPKKYPGKLVWPKGTNSTDGYWGIERVREATSVPLRLHLLDRNAGRIPEHPTFTIRVAAKAKSVIRRQLATLFGYSHQTLFGDLPGFARFGNSHLRTTPP